MALLALVLLPLPARPADARPARPTLVIRVNSVERLVADARYLVERAGREDQAQQFEKLLRSRTGVDGLGGIDPRRPFGLYGKLGPGGAEDSEAVLMLPVADEKALLDTLEKVNLKADKGEGGLYTIEAEKVPFPVYFRFANQYVYATLRDKENVDRDRLPAPAVVLPPGQIGTLTVLVNLDQVPDRLKEMALGQFEQGLQKAKEQDQPGETEAGKAFRVALIDRVGVGFKALLEEGQEARLRLRLDRKAGDLTLALNLSAQPGSKLAGRIARLGQGPSIAAGLVGTDSAMHALVNLSLPAELRKTLAPVIDEGVKKALAKEKDEARREALGEFLKALTPTLKRAQLDAGFDLRGPGEEGLYTLVLGAKVQDGAGIDRALRDVFKKIPREEKKGDVKLDVDRAGSVAIHRVVPDKMDRQARDLFGDHPFYFAVRPDALLLSAGAKGLEAIKEAAGAAPKPGRAAQVEMSMARMAKLMAREQKSAPEAARQAFAKDPEADKIRVTLEGGQALRLRASMKAQLVTFFSLIDQAEKKRKGQDTTPPEAEKP
jgi:hypothetical protein